MAQKHEETGAWCGEQYEVASAEMELSEGPLEDGWVTFIPTGRFVLTIQPSDTPSTV